MQRLALTADGPLSPDLFLLSVLPPQSAGFIKAVPISAPMALENYRVPQGSTGLHRATGTPRNPRNPLIFVLFFRIVEVFSDFFVKY